MSKICLIPEVQEAYEEILGRAPMSLPEIAPVRESDMPAPSDFSFTFNK